jgi:hypothetical protein
MAQCTNCGETSTLVDIAGPEEPIKYVCVTCDGHILCEIAQLKQRIHELEYDLDCCGNIEDVFTKRLVVKDEKIKTLKQALDDKDTFYVKLLESQLNLSTERTSKLKANTQCPCN